MERKGVIEMKEAKGRTAFDLIALALLAGLLPPAPDARVKTVSGTIPVRRGADGARRDVKPQQEPLTDPETGGY